MTTEQMWSFEVEVEKYLMGQASKQMKATKQSPQTKTEAFWVMVGEPKGVLADGS